jgi:hypothetical protein
MLVNALIEKTGYTDIERAGSAGEDVDPEFVIQTVAREKKRSISSLGRTPRVGMAGDKSSGSLHSPSVAFAPSCSVEMTAPGGAKPLTRRREPRSARTKRLLPFAKNKVAKSPPPAHGEGYRWGTRHSVRVGVRLLAVIRKFLQTAALVGLVTQANGQGIPRPDVPEKIKAPAGEEVVLQAHASGSQIYTCQQGTDGKYAWTLKAPEAELRNQQGAIVGRHYAGPTWKHSDGSEVTGKAVARVDSPDSDSIPWLLVTATGHSGDGVLSRVTSIQRIHTHGGQPPPAADCNASKQNTEAKISYNADYYFFAPTK